MHVAGSYYHAAGLVSKQKQIKSSNLKKESAGAQRNTNKNT